MLVGEVYFERVAGSSAPPMLSAGIPVAGTVIAVNERQVSFTSCRCGEPGPAAAAGAMGAASAAASTATPAIRPNRSMLGTSFESGRRDTADEVTLQQDENDEHRQH